MIKFDKFTLNNGLRVIVHQDKSTPIVAFNIVYNVGARDEEANRTGFAHLFEHLMFGGSVNIPSFDEHLEKAGGENNAFTSNDITNYYETLPKENLETAFWLESDRMLSLSFTDQSLEVQRQVVIEEFKQSYLNQPYGDMSLLIRPLAYKEHPYMWSTIGKEIAHIEDANMQEVKDFFYKHYAPNNAVLCVSGDVSVDEIKCLSKKWFGGIQARKITKRSLPMEPKQTNYRFLKVKRNVPADALQMAFHMCSRLDKEYHATDLLSDILSSGKSSRLYQSLVQEKQIFSELDAYIMGSYDAGLFMFQGKLMPNYTPQDGEDAIWKEIKFLVNNGLEKDELEKVKNKIEANLIFSEMNVLNKAMNLSHFELLGDANLINEEVDKYLTIKEKDIIAIAKEILIKENCSSLHYLMDSKLTKNLLL